MVWIRDEALMTRGAKGYPDHLQGLMYDIPSAGLLQKGSSVNRPFLPQRGLRPVPTLASRPARRALVASTLG